MTPSTPEPPVLLASTGPRQPAAPAVGDLSDWLALMEVVEALCPEWPLRPQKPGTDYRL